MLSRLSLCINAWSSLHHGQRRHFTCRNGGDESIGDLLSGNKGLEETAFASLYTLTKNRQVTSVRITALRVVLEFLQVRRRQYQAAPVVAVWSECNGGLLC